MQAFHFVKIPATNKQVVFQQEFDNEAENVPYISCPQVGSGDTFYFRGNAYLFRDSIPANHVRNPCIMDIVYYTARDSASFYVNNVHRWKYNYLYYPFPVVQRGEGHICNLPAFAKSWNIPPTGKKIYYRGKFLSWGGDIYGTLYGDITLTHLKDTIW